MDADKQAQAKLLLEQAANLLASAKNEDGSCTDDGGFFLAVSHEDRGTPIILMVGPTE